jgi:hypothetical protein
MNGRGKSDSLSVPEKLSNKTPDRDRERAEGRGRAEGSLREDGVFRTQGRGDTRTRLEWVREAAERDRRQRFTTLLHHVMTWSACGIFGRLAQVSRLQIVSNHGAGRPRLKSSRAICPVKKGSLSSSLSHGLGRLEVRLVKMLVFGRSRDVGVRV